jgi:hypothetical protein
MVFDVLVVTAVAATIWWWQRRRPVQARHARGREGDDLLLMPYEDLPPIGAFEPVPDEADLDDYISEGVERLSRYLSRRDRTV